MHTHTPAPTHTEVHSHTNARIQILKLTNTREHRDTTTSLIITSQSRSPDNTKIDTNYTLLVNLRVNSLVCELEATDSPEQFQQTYIVSRVGGTSRTPIRQ